MKKKIILISVLFLTLACKNERQEKMIEKFVIDLFDNTTPAKHVVTNYLEIKKDNKNKLSLTERIEGAVAIIEESRSGKINKGTWLIPNYEIKKISKPKVYPYKQYEYLNEFKFNLADKLKDNMFVLLNDDKNKILQYFLLNETNTKILSFTLFIKAGSAASFFTF